MTPPDRAPAHNARKTTPAAPAPPAIHPTRPQHPPALPPSTPTSPPPQPTRRPAGRGHHPEAGIHEDFEDGVAHALAYGGRVSIRIPQFADGQHGCELPRWLRITKENRRPWEPRSASEEPVYRRAFGTHHMTIGDNGADGTRGDFVEKGEIGAILRNWGDPHSHLYGLPMAVGGMGNTDYHGDTILPNESYGHMFAGDKPPTHERDGAFQVGQVGIETAGPSSRTSDGYKHGANTPLDRNQRLVDLKEFGDWVKKLNELEKAWKTEPASAKTHEERAALYRDLIGRRGGG
ncbi:hypothetical protein [Streptomyces sp. 3213.3]|uniref:hypothetical protein n=1 Tax=Streptomyces sp. 3213.3 TaxID=1855348 RepID=UPI000B2904B0|nr:hypothetical protein [Streptomyces sp. 3213.3]